MFRPPLNPQYRPTAAQPSNRRLVVSYAMVAAFGLSLWVLSNPLLGLTTLAAVAGLVVAVRRGLELGRCLRDCGGFSVDVAGRVQVTVTRPCSEQPC